MSTFDLNIHNYTRDELIDLFDLSPSFQLHELDASVAKMRDKIAVNRQMDSDTQLKMLNFISSAKTIILSSLDKGRLLTEPLHKGPPVGPALQSSHENASLVQKKIEDFYNSSYELKPTAVEDPSEHMVQMRKEKPYLSSYPSEFFAGVINPLKKRTIKKILNIDTRFRDNYYSSPSSNFNLNLPMHFNNVVQMQLSSIELPMTFFVVSKQFGNNFFVLTVNDVSAIITIPDGNYTSNTIMNAMNASLQNARGEFANVAFKANLTENSQTGSGQTLVGPVAGNTTVNTISLNFQADRSGLDDKNVPLPLKLGWLLGFRAGQYFGNLNYVSEGIIDLSGPKYMFLVVDDFNNSVNNSFYGAFNSSILNKNILARISLQIGNGPYQSFRTNEQNNLGLVTTPREYFGPVNIQTMTIQLLDEYGRIVALNNMDYSFCLTLTTVYDL